MTDESKKDDCGHYSPHYPSDCPMIQILETKLSDKNFNLTKEDEKHNLAIEKLTNIAYDLNRLISVHEERLNQNTIRIEKNEIAFETRKNEANLRVTEVYKEINLVKEHVKDHVMIELDAFKREVKNEHSSIFKKLAEVEKKIWIYLGSSSVIIFILAYSQNVLRFFKPN